MFIEQHQPQHLLELDQLVNKTKPCAIGEVGLDFYLSKTTSSNISAQTHDPEKQITYFAKQIIIAKRHDLPLIIHCRKAHDDCIKLLRQHSPKGGIIHAFNGSIQQAHKYIELGFILGFGGMLTYPRSSKLRALASNLPLDSIALETDAPDMTVMQHRGQRNSPAYLPLVADALAELRNIDKRTVSKITTENVHRVLDI